MARFATGKYANAICDRCGIRCKYRELMTPTFRGRPTGLRVCPRCYDEDHPQNFLPEAVVVDAQALHDARPDTGLAASRGLHPPGNWPPYPPPPAADGTVRSGFRASNVYADGETKR